MNGTVDRPVEWAIVVLNRGWGASSLLPEGRTPPAACGQSPLGGAALLLVYSAGLATGRLAVITRELARFNQLGWPRGLNAAPGPP